MIQIKKKSKQNQGMGESLKLIPLQNKVTSLWRPCSWFSPFINLQWDHLNIRSSFWLFQCGSFYNYAVLFITQFCPNKKTVWFSRNNISLQCTRPSLSGVLGQGHQVANVGVISKVLDPRNICATSDLSTFYRKFKSVNRCAGRDPNTRNSTQAIQ